MDLEAHVVISVGREGPTSTSFPRRSLDVRDPCPSSRRVTTSHPVFRSSMTGVAARKVVRGLTVATGELSGRASESTMMRPGRTSQAGRYPPRPRGSTFRMDSVRRKSWSGSSPEL